MLNKNFKDASLTWKLGCPRGSNNDKYVDQNANLKIKRKGHKIAKLSDSRPFSNEC